jgi:hypothetical protein
VSDWTFSRPVSSLTNDPFMGDPTTSYCRRGQGTTASARESRVLPRSGGSSVALTDFVLALSGLLGSLLIPFAGLYWMLRLKRRAVAPAVAAAAASGPVK